MGRRNAVKWWLIGVLVLGLIVSSAVLIVRHVLVPDAPPSAPPIPPAPPSPSSSASPGPPPNPNAPRVIRPAAGALLPGAGAGDVYVQSATAIYRVELATSRITRTPTPVLEQFSSFVAGPGWVVFKTIDNDPGVVVRNGRPAAPLPPGLRPNGRLHPGPQGDLWLTPEEATAGARVVTRVDVNGRPVHQETIRLPGEVGTLAGDGTGYLIMTNAAGVYQARPGQPRKLSTGALIAIGRHQLLVWDCDSRAECDPYLVHRVNGARTRLPPARRTVQDLYQGNPDDAGSYGGELNPRGTYAALEAPGTEPDRRPLAVLDLATGQSQLLPGSLTDSNANTQLAWTPSSRWLLALTDHQLRAYDVRSRQTRTIRLNAEPLLHLTMLGATGN